VKYKVVITGFVKNLLRISVMLNKLIIKVQELYQ